MIDSNKCTFTVKNPGNVPIATFAVNDTKVGGITCAPAPNGGALAVGATTVCTANYTTTGADVGRKITTWAYTLGGNAVTPVATMQTKTEAVPTEVFEDIPDMADDDIGKVMEWIKTKATQKKLPFCWK